jgi:hypothetical protein
LNICHWTLSNQQLLNACLMSSWTYVPLHLKYVPLHLKYVPLHLKYVPLHQIRLSIICTFGHILGTDSLELLHLKNTGKLIFLNIIWKESIRSDGHQFHQYQQNKQPPHHLNWTHWTQKDHDIWRRKSRSWLGSSTKHSALPCLFDTWPLSKVTVM